MSRKQLTKETQSRVNQYMDYLFESQNENKSDENTILAMLSDGIQEQIKREINGKVLKENKLFQRIFGTKFLALLSHHLEEKIYSPSEIIYDESDKRFGIFFISSGSVEIIMGGNHQTIQSLEKGDYFGELAFFTDTKRRFGARSSSFSSIFLIQKETFLEIAEDYPAEREMYFTIKDRINLNQDYKVLRMTCYSCDKKGHYVSNCPYLHYIPSRKRIIAEYLKEHDTFCKNFRRGLRKRFHVLKQTEQLEFTARMIVNNHRSGKQGFIPRRMSQTIVPINSFPLPFPEKEIEGAAGEQEVADPVNAVDLKKSQTFIPRTDSAVLSRFRTDDFKNSARTIAESEDGRDHGNGRSADSIANMKPLNMKPLNLFEKSPKQSARENEIIFDVVQNFQIYFPHNNVKKIIESITKDKVKKSKKKEIQNQIEGIKMGAERPINSRSSFSNLQMASPTPTPMAANNQGSPSNLKNKYWAMLFRVESMNSHRNRNRIDSDMNDLNSVNSSDSPKNKTRLRPRRVTISQEAPEFREFFVEKESERPEVGLSKSFLESPLTKNTRQKYSN